MIHLQATELALGHVGLMPGQGAGQRIPRILRGRRRFQAPPPIVVVGIHAQDPLTPVPSDRSGKDEPSGRDGEQGNAIPAWEELRLQQFGLDVQGRRDAVVALSWQQLL
ncbi:hypothetical protein PG991_006381 [Apiospora marii]|uniref:Uncharacterized protein n=1 Tax=Apiospora marii TaxID=335849 RepID=A0ABR1SD54_9PEZI